MDRLGAVVGVGEPTHVDLKKAAFAVLAVGDKRAAADLPADDTVVFAQLVARRVEADQHERAPQQHDGAIAFAVADADQAERGAFQEPPVGSRQPLERSRRPELDERSRRDCQLGRLDRARRTVGVDRRRAFRIDDADLGGQSRAAADNDGPEGREQRDERRDQQPHRQRMLSAGEHHCVAIGDLKLRAPQLLGAVAPPAVVIPLGPAGPVEPVGLELSGGYQ